MGKVQTTVHLIALKPKQKAKDLVKQLSPDNVLCSGIPHGWVHLPRSLDKDLLTGPDWSLFLLTKTEALPITVQDLCSKHLAIEVSIRKEQYDAVVASRNTRPAPSPKTPQLPDPWHAGRIPDSSTVPPVDRPLHPGELQLYPPMTTFLATTLPEPVRNAPVSLFNLFKYKNGEPSVHTHYMDGFKRVFGDSAGATVRFMGPVKDGTLDDGKGGAQWDDANLVQYDTIWHYAYMLSTDVYRELNREKVEGLEDTCILAVSEVELSDEMQR